MNYETFLFVFNTYLQDDYRQLSVNRDPMRLVYGDILKSFHSLQVNPHLKGKALEIEKSQYKEELGSHLTATINYLNNYHTVYHTNLDGNYHIHYDLLQDFYESQIRYLPKLINSLHNKLLK